MEHKRPNETTNEQQRSLKINCNYTNYAEGSVLIESGGTRIICTASVEDGVPYFLRGQNTGWLTAEYSLLPRSTHTRTIREAAKGKIAGRTKEIQRLIGRSLRAVIDLDKIGEKTIWLDCDVIQADGGTRTASITGSYIALVDAVNYMIENNDIEKSPLNNYLAAVSVGIVDRELLLDLCFKEDCEAQVDMNVVMTEDGRIIEIQGTAEKAPFTRAEMNDFLDLAWKGIKELIAEQKKSLSR